MNQQEVIALTQGQAKALLVILLNARNDCATIYRKAPIYSQEEHKALARYQKAFGYVYAIRIHTGEFDDSLGGIEDKDVKEIAQARMAYISNHEKKQ